MAIIRITVPLLIAGLLSGPMIALLLAEIYLRINQRLAVPVWDKAILGVFLLSSFLLPILLVVTVGVKLWRRVVPLALLRLTSLIAFLFCASLSLALVQLTVVNAFYDRYSSILSHATAWSANYSEDSFLRVTPGMKAGDVVASIGEPIRKVDNDFAEIWVYSQIGHYRRLAEKGYHQRALAIKNGSVVRVFRRYVTADHTPY